MRYLEIFYLLLTSLLISTGSTLPAQAQNTPSPTYKDVLSHGYEIKAVTFLSDTVSARLAGGSPGDTILVTLQSGQSVATCWFKLNAWLSQNIAQDSCTVGPP